MEDSEEVSPLVEREQRQPSGESGMEEGNGITQSEESLQGAHGCDVYQGVPADNSPSLRDGDLTGSVESEESGVTGPNQSPLSALKQKLRQEALQGRLERENKAGSSVVQGSRESERLGGGGKAESEGEQGARGRLRRTVKPPERFM